MPGLLQTSPRVLSARILAPLSRLWRRTAGVALFSLVPAAAGCGGDASALTAPDSAGGPQPPVASVEIDTFPPSIEVGEETDVEATVKDVFGRPLDDDGVAWSSSDTTVLAAIPATNNEPAAIIGVDAGAALVVAATGGAADSVWVSVEAPIRPNSAPPGDDDPASQGDGPPDSGGPGEEGPPGSDPGPPPATTTGALLAFPGAEGYGAMALSDCRSRPLAVHKVTTTATEGRGSLNDVITRRLSDSNYDIVIFETGGTITVRRPIKITNACVYIAGQTAPGGGVQLRGPPNPNHTSTPLGFRRYREGHDVVIRYLRLRPGRGEPAKSDALGITSGYNIVVDHVSTAFDNDKSITLSPTKLELGGEAIDHITIQWSLITTSLMPHSTANPIGGDFDEPPVEKISIHHNAYIHNSHRNPLIKRVHCIQVINNVIYNWSARVTRTIGDACIDFVGNYYRPGPWSNSTRIIEHWIVDQGPNQGHYVADPTLYMRGNVAEALPEARQEDLVAYFGDREGPLPASAWVSGPQAAAIVPVSSTTAPRAYERVLEWAGASARVTCDGDWVESRDSLDELLVSQVRRGVGPSRGSQTDHQNDYGGYPHLAEGSPCADADEDGMPDDFEDRYGLDPEDASDAALDADGDGYLNIEEYLNGTRA